MINSTDELTPEQYAEFLARYHAARADTRTPAQRAEDYARSLRPDAVDLLTAVAAETGLELSYLACADTFTAHLTEPNPFYRSMHGHILHYQSWNERWSGIGGRGMRPGQVRAYLRIYQAHRDWYADSVFAALARADGWILCTTHSVKFPAGQEETHKAGPCGEQNTAGRCAFTALG
jgi:hypothetical protein